MLVVTRSWAIERLHRIVVAPVTRTIRSLPTEVALGPEDGLRVECVATLDNLRTVHRSLLTERAGALAEGRAHELCDAFAAVADC